MVASFTPPPTSVVPEPEPVLREVVRLSRQLQLARAQLRLSEKCHGRTAILNAGSAPTGVQQLQNGGGDDPR